MDFKVAGTTEFVTALQLDTKLDGIPADGAGRRADPGPATPGCTILDVMAEAIDAPDEMSPYAPRIITVKIPVDKIGEVIGPKGKMINQIQDETGAEISIEDDGTIYIGADQRRRRPRPPATTINAIANPTMPEVGERYLGTVVKTTTFGAFVSLLPGKDGLLHICKLRTLAGGKRVENVEDVVKVGEKIQVEIAEIDARGKLSLVPVVEDGDEAAEQPRPTRRPTPSDRRGLSGSVTRSLAADQPRRLDPHAADRRGRRRTRPPHRPARRAAGRHRAACPASARRRFGVWVGVGSPRRDPAPARAARTSSSTCCSRAPRRASALDISVGDRRGRRRDQRLHRQGVHLLLRAGARRRPAAGDRRASATWSPSSLITPSRRRGRARRDPRRDRHARRRPRRRGPRPVRRRRSSATRPLGRPILGTVESIDGADPRPRSTASTAAATGPRTWSSRPPATSTTPTVVRLVRTAFGRRGLARRRRRRRPAAPRGGRARRARTGGVRVVDPADRAGQPRARRARASPAATSAASPSACSTPRSAAACRQPAVPGGPREARPGLLGLLASHAQYADAGLFGVYAGCLPAQGRRGARRSCRDRARRGRRARHHRRGARPAARASCAAALVLGPGGHRLADDPDRQGRARRTASCSSVDEVLRRIDAVTLDDVRAVAAELLGAGRRLAVIGPFDERPRLLAPAASPERRR